MATLANRTILGATAAAYDEASTKLANAEAIGGQAGGKASALAHCDRLAESLEPAGLAHAHTASELGWAPAAATNPSASTAAACAAETVADSSLGAADSMAAAAAAVAA